MLDLFNKYRAVVKFIAVFLGTYFVLAVLYNWYLEYSISTQQHIDSITYLVALQSEAVVSNFGYNSQIFPDANAPTMNLWVNGNFVARIIEGCNSVSIIILFVAFMLSFFGRIKTTLLFILAGAIIIYAINIARIAILSIGIYELPQYGHFLHKIVFPLIIYGTVFILWVLWIRIYSKQTGK